MALIMVSCSGIPKEKELTVSNVSISGILSDFVKVVDGTYTFTNNGEEAFATIEFELVNEPYGEIAPILSKTNSSQVILQILDSKDNYIELGLWGFSADYRELEKLNDLIYKGKIGDKKRISFSMHYFNSNENGKLVFTNATNFEVVDKAFNYGSDEDVASIKTSDSKSITTKGDNCPFALSIFSDKSVVLSKRSAYSVIAEISPSLTFFTYLRYCSTYFS